MKRQHQLDGIKTALQKSNYVVLLSGQIPSEGILGETLTKIIIKKKACVIKIHFRFNLPEIHTNLNPIFYI